MSFSKAEDSITETFPKVREILSHIVTLLDDTVQFAFVAN